MVSGNNVEFPEQMRDVWDKLVHRGCYISIENDRELYNEIVRDSETYDAFLKIFGHRLVVHPHDFVYAEDLKNKSLLKGHRELICFLAVFFERYRKLHPGVQRPWFEEIMLTTQSLKEMAMFATETSAKRLQQVGLMDEKDIYDKVFKNGFRAGLLTFSATSRRAAEESEAYDELRFQFCSPVRRFIDLFNDLAVSADTETEVADV